MPENWEVTFADPPFILMQSVLQSGEGALSLSALEFNRKFFLRMTGSLDTLPSPPWRVKLLLAILFIQNQGQREGLRTLQTCL